MFELSCNIIGQDRFNQKIKAAIVVGFVNCCKNFKAKIFIIKNLMPLVCENLRVYRNDIDETYI